MNVTVVQETYFICAADCRVQENDFHVFSAYGSCSSAGVSLLVGRSLDADVNVVFVSDGVGCLWPMLPLSFKFRLVVVYAPNTPAESVSFFRRLAPFLDDSKRLVLMGDFVSCPTCHLIAWTDHKLVRVNIRVANRPSLAGYWKLNTSILEIRDFRDRLESLIRRTSVGRLPGIGGGFLLNTGLEISLPSTVDSLT